MQHVCLGVCVCMCVCVGVWVFDGVWVCGCVGVGGRGACVRACVGVCVCVYMCFGAKPIACPLAEVLRSHGQRERVAPDKGVQSLNVTNLVSFLLSFSA